MSTQSRFISNSFQVPNSYIDDYLHLLDGDEVKVLLYLIRRIRGFQKEQDQVSLSQIVSGIKARDGRDLDHGTGLSRPRASECLASLIESRLVIKVSNGSHTEAATYALQSDSNKVNIAYLEGRQKERIERGQKRTAKATSGAIKKRADTKESGTPHVPESGTPHVPESGTPHVPESGTPHVPESGTPHVPGVVRPTYSQNTVGNTEKYSNNNNMEKDEKKEAELAPQNQPSLLSENSQQENEPVEQFFDRLYQSCDEDGRDWLKRKAVHLPERRRLQTLAKEYGESFLVEALTVAAQQSGQSINYVAGICKRSKDLGKTPNGTVTKTPIYSPPAPPRPGRPMTREEIAAWKATKGAAILGGAR